MKDKNGNPIVVGDTVDVNPPREGEDRNFEFTGVIDSFRNGNVVVVDGDDEYFEVETSQVALSE